MNANVIAHHPCTYVSDNVQVCIVEEGDEAKADNCWTVDKCFDPAKRALNKFGDSEPDAMSTTPSGARSSTFFGAGLLGLAGLVTLL